MTINPADYNIHPYSKGTCEVCETTYTNMTTWTRKKGIGSTRKREPCPTCAHPYQLEHIIRGAIEKNIRFELLGDGMYDAKIYVNYFELADIVHKAVIEHWPRKAGG
jgi:hypothetical protein